MISKRIKKIADFVEYKSNVVDVGCDHALLDIYLTKEKKCNCIASDINKNAISGAKRNIKKYELEDKIPLIISDGLKNIKMQKNSIVVIAGMGTSTILEILNSADLQNIKNFIIQTNNDHELLRKNITKKYPYYIEDEVVFEDKNKIYILIKFSRGKRKYNSSDYYLGPILKTKKDEETVKYYQTLENKNKEVLNRLPKKYILKKIKKKKQNKLIKKLNI